jgi:hypothetical protein
MKVLNAAGLLVDTDTSAVSESAGIAGADQLGRRDPEKLLDVLKFKRHPSR